MPDCTVVFALHGWSLGESPRQGHSRAACRFTLILDIEGLHQRGEVVWIYIFLASYLAFQPASCRVRQRIDSNMPPNGFIVTILPLPARLSLILCRAGPTPLQHGLPDPRHPRATVTSPDIVFGIRTCGKRLKKAFGLSPMITNSAVEARLETAQACLLELAVQGEMSHCRRRAYNGVGNSRGADRRGEERRGRRRYGRRR